MLTYTVGTCSVLPLAADCFAAGGYTDLLNAVQRIFRRRKLRQADAAEVFGITQPRLNLALNGRIGEFSIDALVSMLSHAGRHVDVSIRSARRAA